MTRKKPSSKAPASAPAQLTAPALASERRPKANEETVYSWRFDSRLATEHLGRDKYTTSSRALTELVSNAFDADALRVVVEVSENALGGVDRIIVSDNGRGMGREELEGRFFVVGVSPPDTRAARQGRFGVGRLAVHRVGERSIWTTVSGTSSKSRLTFTLDQNTSDSTKVTNESVAKNTPSGTTVTIEKLRDTGKEEPTPSRVANELLAQFCSFLLANPSRAIVVNGEELDVAAMVSNQTEERIKPPTGVSTPIVVRHILLTHPVERSRLPAQVLFTSKGRTVWTAALERSPSPHYLALVECDHLDSILSSNREALIEMDHGFALIKDAAFSSIERYREKLAGSKQAEFIEKAREEDFYPFRNKATSPVVEARQALYDVVLEKVHEHVNLSGMSKKQRAVIFKLLNRAMDNENLLEVLGEVADLSDADVTTFKKVLERTTLGHIVKLSSVVTERLEFLNVLEELVYGSESKNLKERSQLHKILEPHCWIFGNQYHLASSDRSFREVIRQHREAAKLDPAPDEVTKAIQGIQDIPDLFLAAERDYPVDPKHHRLLVELKAPKVSAGQTELSQVRRYAQTVMNSAQLSTPSTTWDIVLVTSKIAGDVEMDRSQEGRPFGMAYKFDSLRVWVRSWSEIILAAREDMSLVKQHLEVKSKELAVSDYLRENFPDVLSPSKPPSDARRRAK